MRGTAAMAGAAAVLAVVSACGGSHPAARAGSTTAAVAPPPVTVTTTSAVPTVTTTAANPSAAVAGGRCHTPQLAVSLHGVDGGADNAGTAIALTNVGSVTCTVYGYPGIGLLTAGRQPDDITVPRGGSYLFTDPEPHTLSLAPGASASAGFGYLDGGPGDFGPAVACYPLAYLSVTPPDETAALTIAFTPGQRGAICGIQGITALTAGSYAGKSPDE